MAKKQITNDEVADILDAAVALMNDEGAHWTKGHFSRKDRKTGETRYCSVGALRKVSVGKSKARQAAYRVLSEEIKDETVSSYLLSIDRVIAWNDRPLRTWKDLSKTFKAASSKLRKRKTPHPKLDI